MQLLFQLTHGLADCRSRHAELASSAAEAARASHSQEGLQLRKKSRIHARPGDPDAHGIVKYSLTGHPRHALYSGLAGGRIFSAVRQATRPDGPGLATSREERETP